MSDTPQTDAEEVIFSPLAGDRWVRVGFARQLERERDEAREKAERYRLEANALMLQRDEARESLKHISEYGTDEINAAVELRQKLATALVERDEARTDLEHWKSEWEIVEARLCGWKHPRDNGIIFEHEVIPVLRKERDEARAALERIYQASMVARSLEEDFSEWEKAIEMLLDLIKKEAQ